MAAGKAFLIVLALVGLGFFVSQNTEFCYGAARTCIDLVIHFDALIMFLLYLFIAQWFFMGPAKVQDGGRAFGFSLMAAFSATGLCYANGLNLFTLFMPVLVLIPLIAAALIILKLLSLPFQKKEKPSAPGGAPTGQQAPPQQQGPKIKMRADLILWIIMYVLAMWIFKAQAVGITVAFVLVWFLTKIPWLGAGISSLVNKVFKIIMAVIIIGFIVGEFNPNWVKWMPIPIKTIYSWLHTIVGPIVSAIKKAGGP